MNTTEILRLTSEISENLKAVELLWDKAMEQSQARSVKAA